ncbi:alginate lyase family protein [Virgibacillus sp. L01]|uniref:alginate lyase family protein n=1 Tax=Virgibacillus sp. L01 TaxID=3457429 RepID=UPI003FD5E6BA
MYKNKDKIKFFYSQKDSRVITEYCRNQWKDEVKEVIERANMACENTFIFTHRWDMERCETPITFEKDIDWTYRYQDDFEWTVNLNRARFMSELGQAYWLTGDEKFVENYIRLMKNWLSQNPLSEEEVNQSKVRQYNVKDTWRKLDSGIRITNWIKGYYCVCESSLWGENEESRFIEAVRLHGMYLNIAYTPHDKQSNWGFLATNGLFQIALLFPQLEESSGWLDLALERLEIMCRLQVFGDGMHNEQSPMYHHEVLHCLFEPVLLAEINQLPISQILKDTLNKMFTASLKFIKPNGRQPMLSDSDHTDIRDVLSRGAVLYKRGDLKHQGYKMLDYEGIWYYGRQGIEIYDGIESEDPDYCSAQLEQAGYSIMRSDWSKKSQYLLFDGGHMDIIRAHGHDDFLHFDLHAHGSDLLVDTGRYTYMENDERRYFKESFQHNTTSVDDQSISCYQNSWSWNKVAQPTNQYWKSHPLFDYVQAGHTGYCRLEDPVQVLRQIFYVKPHYWILVDTFRSRYDHEFKQHFHFDENLNFDIDQDHSSIKAKGINGVNLNMISLESIGLTREECWISRNYNEKKKSSKLITNQQGRGLTKFVTALVPYREGMNNDFSIEKVEVFDTNSQKLSDEEVTAIEINRKEESEVILFSHQGPFSYQFSGTHMTGEVLFIKREKGKERSWVVKV